MTRKDKSLDLGVFDDVSDILKDGVEARLGDPIISTYVISFLVTNWQILLLAFTGEMNANSRVEGISELFGFEHEVLLNIGPLLWRILIPAVVTGFYIFLWPKIMKAVFAQAERNRIARVNAHMDALEGRTDVRLKIKRLSDEIKITNANNENRIKRIGVLEEENKVLKEQLERANALASALEKQRETTIRQGAIAANTIKEQNKFLVPIREYANQAGIDVQDALRLYEEEAKSRMKDLFTKNPHSESLKRANDYLGRVLKDPTAPQSFFWDPLRRFEESNANLEEERAKVKNIRYIVEQIFIFKI